MKKKRFSLRQKNILTIVCTALLLGIAAISVSTYVFSREIDAEYEDRVTDLAETVGIAIDKGDAQRLKDRVEEIYDSVGSKVGSEYFGTPEYDEYISNFSDIESTRDYLSLKRTMRNILDANGVESIYIICIEPQDMKSLYLVDASDDPVQPGNIDPLYEENRRVIDDPEYGFPAYITNTKEYGWLISAGCPIYNDNGEVFAYTFVDISMNEVKKMQTEFRISLGVVLLLITIVMCIANIIVTDRMTVKPINTLANAASDYYKAQTFDDRENPETHTVFEHIDIHTGDEIESLSDAMKKMEQDINVYISNLTQVTAEKERIGAELNVATQIQADMLPRIFPPYPDRTEFDIYATMDPAKEVGGDFYDFFLIDDDHIGLVMADVSGKGVPAALFMVIAKTLIKNRAMMGGGPAEVLEYVNDQLCEGNEAELFVTVWLGIFTISTGKGLEANAGHEHPAIRRKDGSFELVITKHSMPVATMEGIPFRQSEFELHPGDTLFVYTDGVAEATNSDNELYGTDRMIGALNKNADAAPEELLRNVKGSVDSFVGEAPQFDDLTMLAFKYYGP